MVARHRATFSMRRGVAVMELALQRDAPTSGIVLDLGRYTTMSLEPIMSAYRGMELISMRPVFQGFHIHAETGPDATYRFVENFEDLFGNVNTQARFVDVPAIGSAPPELPSH